MDEKNQFVKSPTTILGKIFFPFSVIRRTKGIFALWVLVVVGLSNAGVFITWFSSKGELGFVGAMKYNVHLGNVLTAGIAMLAWGFYDFLKEIMTPNKSVIHHRDYKTVIFTLAAALLVFHGLIAMTISVPLNSSIKTYLIEDVRWWEILLSALLWLVGLLVSSYIYCVSLMESLPEIYGHLDQDASAFNKETKQSVRYLGGKALAIEKIEEEGVEL